jgi:cytochrome c
MPASAPGCPKSLAGWQAWRNRAVSQLLAPRPKLENVNGPFLDPDQVAAQSVAVANFLDDCTPGGSVEPHVLNLWQFTQTQRLGLDVYHQFAHTLADAEYLDRVKSIASLPCLLGSAEFLKNISDPATYGAAAGMVDKQNGGQIVGSCQPDGTRWQTLFYRSAFLGTPDDADAFGRFLVVVPGATHDRWIQFGIWAPGEALKKDANQNLLRINNVSVVAAAKDRVAGDGRFNVVLDWWRNYDADAIRVNTRRDATGVTGNCQQCHKTSVIGIHPLQIYRPDGGQLVPAPELHPTVDALNESINKLYRFPTQSLGDEEDAAAAPTRYGPGIGPDDLDEDRLTLKPALMKACTAGLGLNAESIARVSGAMNCAQCHNHGPRGRGALNFPQATQRTKATALKDGQWPNLIYAYIKQGLMPPPGQGAPEPPLTLDENEALFECLSLEYHDPQSKKGLLADWLKSPLTSAQQKGITSVAALNRAMALPVRKLAPVLPAQRTLMIRTGGSDFAARCARCHSTVAGQHGTGPSLAGVFDRLAGATSGFEYSGSYVDAGKQGVHWDEANLMAFLIDQPAFLAHVLNRPATSEMDKHYADEGLRRGIVQYLKTLP